MIQCKLDGLTLDQVPKDSIRIGKLTRFTDGTFHLFRKQPKQTIKQQQRNPDKEAPSPPMGTHASEVRR